MTWLIYGHKGWIGSMFCRELDDRKVDWTGGESRVDDTVAVEAELNRVKPTRVVSFIGRTSGPGYNTIDYLEQKGKLVENLRDNLFGPVSLALLCETYGVHFTYLGTGCIFSYENETDPMFTEDSLPNFTGSGYSTVKGFTDRLMHLLENNTLNVRIRMPIVDEDHPKNFISKILRYKKICSTLNSMTVLPDLLPVLFDWVKKGITGTHHLISPGPMNHSQILSLYREIVDPSFVWEEFSESDQDAILASRRSKNVLSTEEIERDYPFVPRQEDSLRAIFANWKKSDF